MPVNLSVWRGFKTLTRESNTEAEDCGWWVGGGGELHTPEHGGISCLTPGRNVRGGIEQPGIWMQSIQCGLTHQVTPRNP